MGKPMMISVVIKAMKSLKNVKFLWQLLALRQRFDMDPYSLSYEELVLLKNYQINEARTTNDR